MTNYAPDSQPTQTKALPTMYDLPSEDPEEPGLPDEFHDFQPELLRKTCRPSDYPLEQVFIGSDINLYYDSNHFNWYKRPDWFVVLGVPRLFGNDDLRQSYVIWQEIVSPLVVVELLSPGTENDDLGLTAEDPNKPPTKWRVYERILQIPYYFVFSRYTNELRVFRLIGNRYREQFVSGLRFWIPELQLSLGLWEGSYENCHRLWLRWYNAGGDLILTPEEERDLALEAAEQQRLAKESAIEQAEQQRLAKESEQQRANRMAEVLRAIGINPDEL